MTKVSILIPIHNRLTITKEGLKSLYNALSLKSGNSQNTIKYEIVVIDDGSTDGSSEWILENYYDIHVLLGDGNLWWTGAINKGAKYAVDELKSDYILLWNDDTTCEEKYFLELDKIIIGGEYRSHILASKIYCKDRPDTLFNFGCYYDIKTGKKKLNGANQKDNELYNDPIKIDWSGGMGTLIPVDILVSLNYFDNINFPQYHGDSDFFLRANKNCYVAYAIPTLKIWNNIDTTGINQIQSISELRKIIKSNRSNDNFSQNYNFNKRHSNTFRSHCILFNKYLRLVVKALLKQY